MAQKDEPIIFHLAGPTEGPPTVEDIVALTKALTGKEPSPAAQARVRARLQKAADESKIHQG